MVEVVASKFPGTIEGGLDRHYGFNLLESALAQSAREEVNEGTYWGIGAGCTYMPWTFSNCTHRTPSGV